LAAFVALPFGAAWVFRNLDVALLFILAMLGIEVIAVIMAGWASNNKWSVYGAMREACQIVSYEIPMGMALLIPVMCAGTLKLSEIGAMQADGWFSWLAFRSPFVFCAMVAYYVASLASCKRAPFDLPESESELVAGFLTEYSGIRWSLFFFAEYAAMFVVSALATILFLGAWHSPLPARWADGLPDALWADALRGLVFGGPIWLLLKSWFLIFVQMWLRWTLPRIRIDQVLYACVQVMLPLTMVLLVGNTVWELLITRYAGFQSVAAMVTILLGLLGILLMVVFFGIALYGWTNRRRLVGSMAVQALPGA
jgi:NADH-quinone oxidoreductase subunit H